MTRLSAGSATDIGRRQINQDRVLVATDGLLFAVADGMGGHRRGEVAAQMTVTHLAERMAAGTTLDALMDAVSGANRLVFEASNHDPELQGMGTTLTALALIRADGEDRLAIANVGDSRTYLMRGGELEQLTEDHSLVAEMVREGHLTAEAARHHRQRSVLTKALGVEPSIDADVIEVLPSIGDRYLLCSDGLCGEVSDEQTASVLRRLADPDEAARELVRLALVNGGSDNISVVVVDVVDDGDAALRASAAVEPSRHTTHDRDGVAEPSGVATPGGTRSGTTTDDEPRSPRLVTWRVLVFVVALALLAAVAAIAIGNAPKDQAPPATTQLLAPTTTVDPFAPVETSARTTSAPTTSAPTISATTSLSPGPTTTA